MPGGELLQIGEVAEKVGLSLRTVRYYEEVGLIVPARRTDGGFRLYTDLQVDRLLVIKQMKPLGFSIQEMVDLLTLRDQASAMNDPATKAALNEFATMVHERCRKLREAARNGTQLAAQLEAESQATTR